MKSDRRMTARLMTVSAVLVGSLGLVVPTAVLVGAVGVTENNQVPIENHPGNGSLHIIADDTLDIEVVDPPSILYPTDAQGGTLPNCTSATHVNCNGKSSLEFVAHLPACDTNVTIDCIAGVSATSADGTTSQGTFARYFPDQGPHSFTGDPAINLPSGRAPNVWSIPGAPHAGGDEYAVVARLRGSTRNRAGATFQLALTPVSVKTDAHTGSPYLPPRYVSVGQLAGPASDRGLFRCAYWGDAGDCLLSRDFPVGFSYSVTVRLAVEPAGWLHGRIDSPTITFTKDGSATVVSVSAKPVQVPAFQIAKQILDYPSDIQTAFRPDGPYGEGGSRQPNGQYNPDPTLRNAEYLILAAKAQGFEQLALLTPVIGDKATYAPWIWRVRTLDEPEMQNASECLKTGDGVKGMVTTNATVYGSGPPAFNSSTSTLDYKVAAPHLLASGETFKGSYTMIMKTSVARCIYNFTNDPITASISVAKESGTDEAATTSVNEADGWLTLSATGFTHSAPIVRVQIKQTATAVISPSPTPSGETEQAPTVSNPATTTSTRVISVKPSKSVAASALVKKAGLSAPRGSIVKLVRAAKYARVCSIVKTQVRALKAGTCVVTVMVTRAGKTKRGQVTLKVA